MIGLAEAIQILRNMIAQAQGKCDWVPCVWPWTLPTLAAFVLLAASGAALVTWTELRRRS